MRAVRKKCEGEKKGGNRSNQKIINVDNGKIGKNPCVSP
jgi:hypothetical protein